MLIPSRFHDDRGEETAEGARRECRRHHALVIDCVIDGLQQRNERHLGVKTQEPLRVPWDRLVLPDVFDDQNVETISQPLQDVIGVDGFDDLKDLLGFRFTEGVGPPDTSQLARNSSHGLGEHTQGRIFSASEQT